LFLLDEAAQLGTLHDLVTAVTLLRGYGVRVWSFWQDLAQLKANYPKAWPTLLANARTLQLFEPHWLFRRELATLLHVLPDDLALPPDAQLLVGPDGVPRRARKADYLTDALFAGHFDANPLAPPPRQR
ncbi:MAG: TraM recognition domain-containing protein, partial [Bacteroidota bacterium]